MKISFWDFPTFKLVDPPCSRSKNTTTSVTFSFSLLSTSAVSRTLAPLEMTRFFQYPIFLISVLAKGRFVYAFYFKYQERKGFRSMISSCTNFINFILISFSINLIKSFFTKHFYQSNLILSLSSIGKLFCLLSSKCTLQKIC